MKRSAASVDPSMLDFNVGMSKHGMVISSAHGQVEGRYLMISPCFTVTVYKLRQAYVAQAGRWIKVTIQNVSIA